MSLFSGKGRGVISSIYTAGCNWSDKMKPHPCGFLGDRRNSCSCTPAQIQRYQSRISGPLLDRIDLHLSVAPLQFEEISGTSAEERSAAIRQRVKSCRDTQSQRFAHHPGVNCNGQMKAGEIEQFCRLDRSSQNILQKGMEKLKLSARGYHRILKIARTIADLDHSLPIGPAHIAEAIQYRRHSY